MPEPLFTTVDGPDGPIPVMRVPDLQEGLQQAALNLPPGALSNFLTPPDRSAWNLAHTGAALRAYDFVAGVPTALMNAARAAGFQGNTEQQMGPGGAAVATPTTELKFPGQDTVEHELEAIKERSRGLMPYNIPAPVTPGGEMGAEVGHSVGSFLVPIPSGPYRAAGKVAGHLAEIILPSAKTGAMIAPFAGALTGAMEAASYAENPAQYEAHVAGNAEKVAEASKQPQSTNVAPIAQPTPGTQGPAATPPPAPTDKPPEGGDYTLFDSLGVKPALAAPAAPSAEAAPLAAPSAAVTPVADKAGADYSLFDSLGIKPIETPTAPSRGVARDEQGRAQEVHDEFVKRGWSDAQAWGFASNALHESGGKFDTRPGDRGASHGLFQWQGSRLRDYVARYGHLPRDGSTAEAVDFADWELRNTERRHAGAIAAARTPAEAAAVISARFIRPAAQLENMQRRGATATRIAGAGTAGPPPQAVAQAQPQAQPAVDYTLFDSVMGGNKPAAAPSPLDTPPPVDYSQSQGTTGTTAGTVLLGTLAALGGLAAHHRITRGAVGAADRVGLAAARDAEVAAENARVANRTAPGSAEPVGNVSLPPRDSGLTGVARLIPKVGASIDEAVTKLKANWRDFDAPMQRLEDAMKETKHADPQFADKLNLRNDMPVNAAILEQARSGRSFLTGRSVPKAADYIRTVESMSDADRTLYNNAAQYANEGDRRNLRAAAGLEPKFDFAGIDTATMQATEKAAAANPVVSKALDLQRQLYASKLEDAVQTGRITREQANQWLKERPNYVAPIGKDGITAKPFIKESILDAKKTGEPASRGSVVDAVIQEHTNAYKDMARERVDGSLVQRYHAASQANPKLPQVFSESKDAKGTWVKPAGEHKVVYTPSGEQYYNVHNKLVARNLRGLSPIDGAMLGAAGRFSTGVRRTIQSFNTGLPAIATGKVFPAIGNVFNAALIPVIHDKKLYGGFIDKALRQATGGRIGSRLPDPAFVAGSLVSGVKDATSVATRRFAEAMHPESSSQFGRGLRALLGDASANSLQGNLQRMWERSILAEKSALGIGGAAGHYGGVEAGGLLAGEGAKAHSPLYGLSPNLFSPTTRATARISKVGGHTVASIINTKSLAEEMYNALNEGAHSQQYRLNRGRTDISPTEIAGGIRKVTGDPGVAGGGNLSRTLAASVPYYNTSVQGLGAFADALGKHPIGVASGTAATLTALALAEQYSAMVHGEGTTNFLANAIPTSMRARAANIFHSSDPTHRTEIPIPYEFRAVYPFIQELVAHATGSLNSGKPGEPAYERLVNMLHGVFNEHVSQSTATSSIHGLGDLLNIVQVPPILNAALGGLTGGKSIDIRPDQMLLDYMHGKNPIHNVLRNGGYSPHVPNAPDPSNQVTDNDAGSIKAILQNLVGLSAESVQHLGDAYNKAVGGDVGHALTDFVADWKQQFKDRNPLFGALWNNSSALSRNMPLEEKVRVELDQLKGTAGAAQQESLTGLTREGGRPIEIKPGEAHVPPAGPMRNMFMESSAAYDFIKKAYLPHIQDIEKQLDAIKTSDKLTPEQKRAQSNELTAEMYTWYQKVDDHLETLNRMHSRTAGVKVPRGAIDYHHPDGVGQFR